MALQLRRGTDAERQVITPFAGELIYTTDTKGLWIGDGVTQGGVPAIPVENTVDVVATALENGSHTGITFTYNDEAGTIDASVATVTIINDTTPELGGALNARGFDIFNVLNLDVGNTISMHGGILDTRGETNGNVITGALTTNEISPLTGNNLSVNGTVSARSIRSNFIGSVYADDSTTIVNGLTGAVFATSLEVANTATFNGLVNAIDIIADFTGSVYSDNKEDIIINSATKGVTANSINGNSLSVTGSMIITTVPPAHSTGTTGDVAGMVAFNSGYIYYCTTDYTDGLSDIWKRIIWSSDTW